jgi:hypothetical protein
VSRLRSRDAGLSEAELIVTRAELEALRDKLYVLSCAIEDVRRDLDAGEGAAQALAWVLEAAEPLLDTPLGKS